ncbi:hypothetical protein Pyn_09107 [Prunus yedoensis var. nudiflora]|uniref:Uncharacterized protein n=1 Tax=Prunus yedoensis var. nudiflora TaxID=2094558 RepID=A0A314ZAB1_PRUYE|nr:hypothetical protein Pyn_09107 [Prunus yedoensis var. nudiflora]
MEAKLLYFLASTPSSPTTLSSQNLQEQDTTISSQGSHLPVQEVSESLHPFTTALAVMVAALVVRKLTVIACRRNWHRTPQDCDFERGREGRTKLQREEGSDGDGGRFTKAQASTNLLLLRRSGTI